MDIEKFREFCISLDGVTEKTPFGKFAKRYESILAFYVLDHMFCFIDMDDFSFVNVKPSSEDMDYIRSNYSSITNPINRALKYWIQLDFYGDIPESEIYDYVLKSYDIVKRQYTPKTKKSS